MSPHQRILRILLIISFVLTAVFMLWLAFNSSAKATDIDWNWELHGYRSTPVKAKRRYARRQRESVRYYAAPEWDVDDGNRRPRCLDSVVEITSTEHQDQQKAMDVGRKMWSGTTQWKWGSQYMNINNATEMRAACDQTNDMASASGRVSEAAGTLTGKDGVNVRCVIRARPCRALLEPVEGQR